MQDFVHQPYLKEHIRVGIPQSKEGNQLCAVRIVQRELVSVLHKPQKAPAFDIPVFETSPLHPKTMVRDAVATELTSTYMLTYRGRGRERERDRDV